MKDWEKEFENNIANYQNGIKLSDIINPDYLKDFIQDCITAREKEIVEAIKRMKHNGDCELEVCTIDIHLDGVITLITKSED